jgi:hypothetical protein
LSFEYKSPTSVLTAVYLERAEKCASLLVFESSFGKGVKDPLKVVQLKYELDYGSARIGDRASRRFYKAFSLPERK